MGAYDHIRVDRHGVPASGGPFVLNRRTKDLFAHAKRIYYVIGGTGDIEVAQGSYHPGTDVSGGTHDGGGAVDSKPTVATAKNWRLWEKALRMAMFMAYDRPTIPGTWNHHNHSAPLGDRDASGALKRQYQDYYVGRDALASHRLEPASKYRPPVLFNPIWPLHLADLSNIRDEAKRTRGHTVLPGVKYVQRALNVKMGGTDLVADGIFGPTTRKHFARWETAVGGDGDGIPGEFALTLLGAGRFNVRS